MINSESFTLETSTDSQSITSDTRTSIGALMEKQLNSMNQTQTENWTYYRVDLSKVHSAVSPTRFGGLGKTLTSQSLSTQRFLETLRTFYVKLNSILFQVTPLSSLVTQLDQFGMRLKSFYQTEQRLEKKPVSRLEVSGP